MKRAAVLLLVVLAGCISVQNCDRPVDVAVGPISVKACQDVPEGR